MKQTCILPTLLSLVLCVTLPVHSFGAVPGFETYSENVIYYNPCDGVHGSEVNSCEAIESELVPNSIKIVDTGLFGCALDLTGNPFAGALTLRSTAFSPHAPLTISFWWTLPKDLSENESFGLASLRNSDGGVILLLARGGPWSGLRETGGVAQIQRFADISDVSKVYDEHLAETLSLKAGKWHHTVMVFTLGSRLQIYTDGELSTEVTITGRDFKAEDNINTIHFGSGIQIDEIVILDKALDADSIQGYFKKITALREYSELTQGAGKSHK